MWRAGLIGVGLALGIGCIGVSADTGKAVIGGTAEGSSVSGTATLTDGSGALQVTVEVTGVPEGQHGFHIHQYGECGDGGKAAGGHFNPDGVQHGFLPTDGSDRAHAGDLGNIVVGADGSGTLSVALPGVSLSGAGHRVGGRAFILHEQPDDFGQPTGNAGGRIGCGTIVLTKE